MKKLILLFLTLILFAGCEKDFDTLLDPVSNQYQVIGINSFNGFTYLPDDSLITLTISFRNSNYVSEVFADIISSDDNKINSSPVFLRDNGNSANGDISAGDNTYSAKFPLSQYYPNGQYRIKYFVTDSNNKTKQAAFHNFTYNNGQANAAPVISDNIIEPDTLVVIDTTAIFISMKATDDNGANDIESVYFTVFRPDSTTSGNRLELFDSGNLAEHGDQISGDGIFSRIIQVDQNNMKGTYRFEFQARDRGKKLSNIINHNVVIL
jgi:hypothetical protein